MGRLSQPITKHPQHAKLPKWADSWGKERCSCGSRSVVQKRKWNNPKPSLSGSVICLRCRFTVQGCTCPRLPGESS